MASGTQTSLVVVVLVIHSVPMLLGGMAQPLSSSDRTVSRGEHKVWSAFGMKDLKEGVISHEESEVGGQQ